MRKRAMIIAGLVLFLPFIVQADDEEGYDRYGIARLSFVKGDVVVERANEMGTEEGIVNLVVVEGDKLATQAGRAEVHFAKKNYLRLDDRTQVEFAVLPREGDNRVRLHLLDGNVYLRISFLEEEKVFEVHTPDASFYILEEGLYRFDVRPGGGTEIAVVEGSAEAAGESGSRLVGSRESLVASSGQLGTQRLLSSLRDNFHYWNEERDSLIRQYASRRYLPSELDEYEYELDTHGRWVYERPYGYVWVPYIVDSYWRPYYYGRWVWYPVFGWTWVSYEPWGWCVYHYGRWHWRLGLGWYWIPTRHWGPAWVHWYWGHDYIGWCPLSWYNRPVVIVNNYFYDRYHHSYYPAHSRALTVVRKSQLQSPNVSHVALSRVEASRLGQITLQERQPDIKPTISRSSLAGSSGVKSFSRPQAGLTGKASDAISRGSVVRTLKSPAGDKDRPTARTGRVEPSTKSVSRNLSESRSVGGYPSASPRTSSLRGRTSSPNRMEPKAYSSNPVISRPGLSKGSSPDVSSFGSNRPREDRPQSPSFSSTWRRESTSLRNSPSSSSKSSYSISRSYSAPSSFSAPRSAPRSSPSFSRSPSSSPAPARSAPNTSSSSRSSSGRVVKKDN
ncbi:MAG: FecR domain-containing protein [Clostridiales bacterium]|nr:FecR domain-containing protein [Clostridiales bacterium]